MRKYAAELVALAPDVMLASSQRRRRAIAAGDPHCPDRVRGCRRPGCGAGYVESLARPGGNATGFTVYEYSIGGKWLELLKEIAPRVTRVAVLRDPPWRPVPGQFGAIQAAGAIGRRGVEPDRRARCRRDRARRHGVRGEPEWRLDRVRRAPVATIHRDLIIRLAAKHRLPAVYSARYFAAVGGLISYGPDFLDQHRRAAGYVDRILKGEKPADLPVQAPTKYELVINLKTAKALGLDVPPSLLARADEVIE